jgi:hypothetical protein
VPEEVLPVSFAGARRLVLPFRDTTDHLDAGSFTRELAADLVSFAKETQDVPAERVVVHCAKGVGRSPAVAYVLLVGAGRAPADALKTVLQVRPQAEPNALVVAHAAALLGPEVWDAFEDWVRTTDWWECESLARLGDEQRVAALRTIRIKRPVGEPRPPRAKRR